MNAAFYILARFYEVRAERARAAAERMEAKAAKFFRSLGIEPKSRR